VVPVPVVPVPVVPVPVVPEVAFATHEHTLTQLVKTVEDIKSRLEFLEYKMRILSSEKEDRCGPDRFINVWLCMYACLYITIPLSLLGLFMYNFMRAEKSPLMLPDRGFDL